MLAWKLLILAASAGGAHARSCWCEEPSCTSAARSSLHCSRRYHHSSAGSSQSLTGFHPSVGALTWLQTHSQPHFCSDYTGVQSETWHTVTCWNHNSSSWDDLVTDWKKKLLPVDCPLQLWTCSNTNFELALLYSLVERSLSGHMGSSSIIWPE